MIDNKNLNYSHNGIFIFSIALLFIAILLLFSQKLDIFYILSQGSLLIFLSWWLLNLPKYKNNSNANKDINLPIIGFKKRKVIYLFFLYISLAGLLIRAFYEIAIRNF